MYTKGEYRDQARQVWQDTVKKVTQVGGVPVLLGKTDAMFQQVEDWMERNTNSVTWEELMAEYWWLAAARKTLVLPGARAVPDRDFLRTAARAVKDQEPWAGLLVGQMLAGGWIACHEFTGRQVEALGDWDRKLAVWAKGVPEYLALMCKAMELGRWTVSGGRRMFTARARNILLIQTLLAFVGARISHRSTRIGWGYGDAYLIDKNTPTGRMMNGMLGCWSGTPIRDEAALRGTSMDRIQMITLYNPRQQYRDVCSREGFIRGAEEIDRVLKVCRQMTGLDRTREDPTMVDAQRWERAAGPVEVWKVFDELFENVWEVATSELAGAEGPMAGPSRTAVALLEGRYRDEGEQDAVRPDERRDVCWQLACQVKCCCTALEELVGQMSSTGDNVRLEATGKIVLDAGPRVIEADTMKLTGSGDAWNTFCKALDRVPEANRESKVEVYDKMSRGLGTAAAAVLSWGLSLRPTWGRTLRFDRDQRLAVFGGDLDKASYIGGRVLPLVIVTGGQNQKGVSLDLEAGGRRGEAQAVVIGYPARMWDAVARGMEAGYFYVPDDVSGVDTDTPRLVYTADGSMQLRYFYGRPSAGVNYTWAAKCMGDGVSWSSQAHRVWLLCVQQRLAYEGVAGGRVLWDIGERGIEIVANRIERAITDKTLGLGQREGRGQALSRDQVLRRLGGRMVFEVGVVGGVDNRFMRLWTPRKTGEGEAQTWGWVSLTDSWPRANRNRAAMYGEIAGCGKMLRDSWDVDSKIKELIRECYEDRAVGRDSPYGLGKVESSPSSMLWHTREPGEEPEDEDEEGTRCSLCNRWIDFAEDDYLLCPGCEEPACLDCVANCNECGEMCDSCMEGEYLCEICDRVWCASCDPTEGCTRCGAVACRDCQDDRGWRLDEDDELVCESCFIEQEQAQDGDDRPDGGPDGQAQEEQVQEVQAEGAGGSMQDWMQTTLDTDRMPRGVAEFMDYEGPGCNAVVVETARGSVRVCWPDAAGWLTLSRSDRYANMEREAHKVYCTLKMDGQMEGSMADVRRTLNGSCAKWWWRFHMNQVPADEQIVDVAEQVFREKLEEAEQRWGQLPRPVKELAVREFAGQVYRLGMEEGWLRRAEGDGPLGEPLVAGVDVAEADERTVGDSVDQTVRRRLEEGTIEPVVVVVATDRTHTMRGQLYGWIEAWMRGYLRRSEAVGGVNWLRGEWLQEIVARRNELERRGLVVDGATRTWEVAGDAARRVLAEMGIGT